MAIKLPLRNYVTLPELCEKWQCSENDLRELIIEKQLIPSLFLGGLSGYFIDFKYDETIWGTTTIEKLRFEAGHEPSANRDLFYLRDPWKTGALDCDFKLCSWSRDSQKAESEEQDESATNFQIEWCQLDKLISLDEVFSLGVVTNLEIARFEAKMDPGAAKDLHPRERDSLLTIIAALCKASGIDPQSRGATKQIVYLTTQVCVGVGPDTVLKALKAIPDALSVRKY